MANEIGEEIKWQSEGTVEAFGYVYKLFYSEERCAEDMELWQTGFALLKILF